MSAPKQSSPLAAGLEVPCPILQSLTDTSVTRAQSATSARVSKMTPIQEEPQEPDDDPCQQCSQALPPDIEEQSLYPDSGESEMILRYVLVMRDAIKTQGERLQQEEAQKAGQEDSPAESEGESEKLDFHINVQKKRPATLLPTAKAHGKDMFSGLKSRARRVTLILPKKKAEQGPKADVRSQISKRFSLSFLANKTKVQAASVASTEKSLSVLFPPVRSKLRKRNKEGLKIKSKYSAPSTPSLAKEHADNKERVAFPTEADVDEEEVDETEEVALLLLRSPMASSIDSFQAPHFYTPMVSYRSRHGNEYRLEASRFRKSIDLAREAASGVGSRLKFHARNVPRTRPRGNGWSRLQ
ncbi:hypothetical protein PV04_08121 [Phialophora macrospora]|uniref:Uncharacterized protein n=1 Tax=Phialophora macrospora TaxID=1851006 RepID=A0A0D2CKV7_9EURO|nr:hypothetical protein PV04_08121 [Phialophora macrospora]